MPGREVKLDDVPVKIMVYPLGVGHIRRFTDDITRIVSATGNIKVTKGASEKEIAQAFVMGLIPLVLTDAIDLVKECTVIDPPDIKFDELPHWALPDIAEAWIDQSFGDAKKWKPWVSLIERTITRVTKKPFSISEIWSKSSSQTAIPSNASSTEDSEGSHT